MNTESGNRGSLEKDVTRIRAFSKNGVRIFEIREDLTLASRFNKLSDMIKQAIAQGTVHIAILFSPDSYLSTRLIAQMVQYYKIAQDRGGSLGVINPNKDIVAVMETIGLLEMIRVFPSIDDVRAP
jgi:anti-anti-sigma regulatory factor